MNSIPLSELIIPENRQRRAFDETELQKLATSIMSKGLLHPPVVRFDGEHYILVAGERRTRAIASLATIDVGISCNNQDFPAGHLPYTLLSDLDPLAIREAELEENIIRVDLSWQERAAAIASLDALRKEQAAARGETHPYYATAAEIMGKPTAQGADVTKVTESIILTKHLSDPDVAKAKSPKDALKIVKKKAEAQHRAVLAQSFNLQDTPHVLHHGSAFDFLPTLPPETFDVILTDPPYGIGADSFGDMAGEAHAYTDTLDYAMDCYRLVAEEGFRVAKPKAHLYVFLDPRYWADISFTFVMAGWNVWPTPLIWNKMNGMLPKPEHGPRRTYEMILFASKGEKKILRVAPDVITVPLVQDRDHGAQKPVLLYRELLSRSALPGNQILDCFAGSGTIFPAANSLKLQATASEAAEQYYHLALSRINEKDDISDIFPGV